MFHVCREKLNKRIKHFQWEKISVCFRLFSEKFIFNWTYLNVHTITNKPPITWCWCSSLQWTRPCVHFTRAPALIQISVLIQLTGLWANFAIMQYYAPYAVDSHIRQRHCIHNMCCHTNNINNHTVTGWQCNRIQ